MREKSQNRNDNKQDPADDTSTENQTDQESQSEDIASSPVEDDDIAARLEQAEQKAEELYDRLLRVSAEFDNYKKRIAREMSEAVKYGNEKLAADILTVVDNLERAIESSSGASEAENALIEGVSLTLNDVLKILERHHVTPVKALGEPFDPAVHQAMMQESSQDHPANTIVKELQKGYRIHDRLLRPAMVVVSSAADNGSQEKSENKG